MTDVQQDADFWKSCDDGLNIPGFLHIYWNTDIDMAAVPEKFRAAEE